MVGRRIGNLEVAAVVGRGAMGTVYQANHLHLKQRFAVKVINPSCLETAGGLKRFEREARVLAAIRHPGIVTVHDFGFMDGELPYLALEFLDGRTLARVFVEGEPLPLGRVGRVFEQILDAVGTAHLAGVVHRDLKPENVLLVNERGRTDSVRVVDFGIAAALDLSPTGLTRTGLVIGTPAFMAPEQLTGKINLVGPSSDLYAIGCMLFQALTGIPPFVADSAAEMLVAQMFAEVPSVSKAASGREFPAGLERLVASMMARDAGARPQRADAAKAELQAALASLPPEEMEATPSRDRGRGVAAFGVDGPTQPDTPAVPVLEGLATRTDPPPKATEEQPAPPSPGAEAPPPEQELEEELEWSPRTSWSGAVWVGVTLFVVAIVTGGVLAALGIWPGRGGLRDDGRDGAGPDGGAVPVGVVGGRPPLSAVHRGDGGPGGDGEGRAARAASPGAIVLRPPPGVFRGMKTDRGGPQKGPDADRVRAGLDHHGSRLASRGRSRSGVGSPRRGRRRRRIKIVPTVRLCITSDPSGAMIVVGGRVVGRTPRCLRRRAGRGVRWRLEARGYLPTKPQRWGAVRNERAAVKLVEDIF